MQTQEKVNDFSIFSNRLTHSPGDQQQLNMAQPKASNAEDEQR